MSLSLMDNDDETPGLVAEDLYSKLGAEEAQFKVLQHLAVADSPETVRYWQNVMQEVATLHLTDSTGDTEPDVSLWTNPQDNVDIEMNLLPDFGWTDV